MLTSVKAIDLVRSLESMKKINGLDVPLALARELAKNAKEIQVVFDEYQKREKAILQKYGKEQEVGTGVYDIPKENLDAVREEMDALNNEDIDVDVHRIEVGDLDGNSMLSVNDLQNLEWWFLDDITPAKPKEKEAAA